MYGNVWNCTELYGKGGKRWEKIGKDGGCIGEYDFSCVANAHVLLNCKFPYLWGRRMCQMHA